MAENEPQTVARCTIKLSTHLGSGECGRLLSDPCGFCKEFDKHAVGWAKIFNEIPRVAVEGDI